MKKFFKEFGAFIKRGNVLDLAVGVIIGGAFTAIVTALTTNILQPLINWLIGGKNAVEAYTVLSPAYDEAGNLMLENSIYINWGAFISAIINFILVALIVFIIVKTFNKVAEVADVNRQMKEKCEKKYAAGEELTELEQKWVKRMEKKNPEMLPKKPEPKTEPAAPAAPEKTETEKLLAQILEQLKTNAKE